MILDEVQLDQIREHKGHDSIIRDLLDTIDMLKAQIERLRPRPTITTLTATFPRRRNPGDGQQ